MALDTPRSQTQDGCRFSNREPVHVDEKKGLALSPRELTESSLDPSLEEGVAVRDGIRIGVVAFGRPRPEGPDVLPASMVLSAADEDPEEPGVEGGLAAEVGECLPGGDEGFLDNVFCSTRIASDPTPRDSHRTIRGSIDEFTKALLVAIDLGLREGDAFGMGGDAGLRHGCLHGLRIYLLTRSHRDRFTPDAECLSKSNPFI